MAALQYVLHDGFSASGKKKIGSFYSRAEITSEDVRINRPKTYERLNYKEM